MLRVRGVAEGPPAGKEGAEVSHHHLFIWDIQSMSQDTLAMAGCMQWPPLPLQLMTIQWVFSGEAEQGTGCLAMGRVKALMCVRASC